MQNKLATWSLAEKERKFDRLLRIIVNRSWLQEAARVTLASSGAKTPGIDGIDKQAMECDLQYQLEKIRSELLDGNYQPQPARRVYIPKANGKQRPLGIPTLRDRMCHADGYGTYLGKRLSSPFLWLPPRTQCASCDPYCHVSTSG
jgi:retron-type reverse transcriptase